MRRYILLFLLALVSAAGAYLSACRHNPPVPPNPAIEASNFPAAIATIFINKCAISGCHNAASYQNADGFLMDTWQHLFNGATDGAMVVPYSVLYSPLLYTINTADSSILIATPSSIMPQSTTTNPLGPLSKAEYDTIKNWIGRGAPDKNGNVAFSSNAAGRQKIYSTQSGCNQIAVIDGQTRLVMRYIAVGDASSSAQHDITVSGDGAFAYVSFYIGNLLEKIDCSKDTVVASVDLSAVSGSIGGVGAQWSIVNLSPDNSTLMVSGMEPNGYIIAINTSDMQINQSLCVGYGAGNSSFPLPHGITANRTFDTFYTTLENGNVINKYWFQNSELHFKSIIIKGNVPTKTSSPTTCDPHQIQFSPDYSRYFVTCQNSNEVRVLDASTDALIDSIPVGRMPQEMTVSKSKNYLFVACMQDTLNTNVGSLGSVYVIDCGTLAVKTVIYGYFYQPHDLAVDEMDGLVFIASRNASATGAATHHSSLCGRPGWYTVYDLNTLLPADNNQYIVLTDPYAIAPRF